MKYLDDIHRIEALLDRLIVTAWITFDQRLYDHITEEGRKLIEAIENDPEDDPILSKTVLVALVNHVFQRGAEKAAAEAKLIKKENGIMD